MPFNAKTTAFSWISPFFRAVSSLSIPLGKFLLVCFEGSPGLSQQKSTNPVSEGGDGITYIRESDYTIL